MKKFLKNFALLLISLSLCLAAIEYFSVKFFPIYNPQGKFIIYFNEDGIPLGEKNFTGRHWDSAGGFNVRVSINQYGFRDKKDLARSRPDDLFVVGDSYAFGWGVEEEQRFSNQLEETLNVPVYNICMPGDFWEYDSFLKYAGRNGATINKIILTVCLQNDLRDYSTGEQKQYVPLGHNPSAIGKIRYYLMTNLTSYNVLANLSRQNIYLNKLATMVGLNPKDETLYYYPTYNQRMIDSSIKKLLEIADRYNTLIVIIPSRGLWLGEYLTVADQIHREFLQQVRASGHKVIDLRPYMEAGGNPLQYHFINEGHWNVAGHRLVASVIDAYIKKERFIP